MFTFGNAIFVSGTLLFWRLSLDTRYLIVEREDEAHSAPEQGDINLLISIIHPDDLPMMEHALDKAVAGVAPLNHEFRIIDPEGAVQWLYVAARWSHDRDNQLTGIALNITAKKAAELQLLEREAQLQAVVEQDQMGIYIKDLEGNFVMVNGYIEKFARLRGTTVKENNAKDILSQRELDHVSTIDQRVIRNQKPESFEWTFERGSDRMTFLMNVAPYLKGGEVLGVVGFVYDVTARRQQEEALAELTHTLEAKVASRTRDLEVLNEKLLRATLHDSLTGLPNRTQLTQRLQQVIAREKAPDQPGFALLFIDLNKFKSVNDNLGHAAGDELLLQVGERLSALPVQGAMVARLGGDEFVLLLEEVPDRDTALRMADQVQSLFQPPFRVGGQELLMSASIGVSLGDYADESAENFLQQADIAMYRAKTSNAKTYQVFEPSMRARRQMLVGLQQDIKHAVRRQELFVEYHPILTLPSRLIYGVEALVRWQHPVHGLISPNEFISIAEEAGVIQEIDLWVFRQACRETADYIRAGRLCKVGFNLSARNFERGDLVPALSAILQEENFPANHLSIEVTESILVQDFRQVSQILWELRNLGVMIAADDFGTGYSSLSYLHRLPFTNLKLDRSFIASVEHATTFIRPVMELAELLDMQVIAEGVESEEQMTMLSKLGCPLAQGFLFYRPMPAQTLFKLLEQPELFY